MIHKILQGDNAGLYLPFGLSRLKELERIHGPKGWFQQKFVVDDATIWVTQDTKKFQYVRITTGGYYFEYFTPGRPITLSTRSQGGSTFSAYDTAVVGVDVNGARATPTLRGGTRVGGAFVNSRVHRPGQNVLIDEPVAYPGPKRGSGYPRAQYESWAPNHPHTGVPFRAYNTQAAGVYSNRGAFTTYAVRDIQYDVPFQDGQGLSPVRFAYLEGTADWPRAAGVRSVTSTSFPTREFAIYIDAFNQVSVFPTGQITSYVDGDPPPQNVDPLYVKTVTPVLPSWVYKPTQTFKSFYADNTDIGLADFPELDWELHPDGTKMCSVVYERAPADFDAAYFATAQGAHPLDTTAFEAYRDNLTGVAARHNGPVSTYLPQRYNSATGVIEVSIDITLTGPSPQEFDVSTTVTEVRRPTTTPYFTVLAGYCWHDIKALDFSAEHPHYDAKRGDMVVLDIERYLDDSTGIVSSFMSLKNLNFDRAAELQSFYGLNLVDYDMKTLSFAIRIPYNTSYNRTLNARPGSPAAPLTLPYTVVHFGVNIWTMNRQREVLYPQTMDLTAKAAIEGIKTARARDTLTINQVLMPLNDLRTWSDPALANLRDHYATLFGYKSVSSSGIPSALNIWWAYGMSAFLPPTGLLYVTDPRFGWYVYTDELLNRFNVTPFSTFFAHPNGTWAFYDQQYIYNRHGMYFGGATDWDALTPFDAAELEHAILDRVHFAAPGGGNGPPNTTFRELYNRAVQRGLDAASLTDTFLPITLANLQVQFTKETYTHTDGSEWLQLKCDWYSGFTAYYFEKAYIGGPIPVGTATLGGGSTGLLDLSLGDIFYSAPAYGGDPITPHEAHTPETFSSCLLVS